MTSASHRMSARASARSCARVRSSPPSSPGTGSSRHQVRVPRHPTRVPRDRRGESGRSGRDARTPRVRPAPGEGRRASPCRPPRGSATPHGPRERVGDGRRGAARGVPRGASPERAAVAWVWTGQRDRRPARRTPPGSPAAGWPRPRTRPGPPPSAAAPRRAQSGWPADPRPGAARSRARGRRPARTLRGRPRTRHGSIARRARSKHAAPTLGRMIPDARARRGTRRTAPRPTLGAAEMPSGRALQPGHRVRAPRRAPPPPPLSLRVLSYKY